MSLTPWEIVTGCERLTPGCDNCPTYWNYKLEGLDYHPVFHQDKLSEPTGEHDDAFIVAPGSDLLHEAISEEQIMSVVDVMRACPDVPFEMGTKRVERLERLGIKWPDNVVVIVAVEESRYRWRVDSLRNVDCKTKMVMFGPLTGRVGEIDMSGIDYAGVVVEHWGPHPRAADPAWADEIKSQCLAQGVVLTENAWLCEEKTNAIG